MSTGLGRRASVQHGGLAGLGPKSERTLAILDRQYCMSPYIRSPSAHEKRKRRGKDLLSKYTRIHAAPLGAQQRQQHADVKARKICTIHRVVMTALNLSRITSLL